MTIVVELFAAPAEIIGRSQVDIQIDAPATVADLRKAMASQHPTLCDWLIASRIAVNHAFADDDQSVDDQQEIALIPPVSGG